MTKSLHVIGNSTLINGQFSFTIFDTYYSDKQSALKRAKSEAKASLANYQKKGPVNEPFSIAATQPSIQYYYNIKEMTL